MGSPRVAFGCPLYNNARQLPQAIESLLSQTYVEFRLILVDDCSQDDTPTVAARYTGRDPRIVHVRNDRRLGYIGNARKCFDLARELFPDIEYFAWASDHDVWHPSWLRSLVSELENDPELVLAYPMTVRISDSGEFRWEPRRFDTHSIEDILKRLRAAFWGMAAGDMVYGLFRRSALERVNGLPFVLLPDRLLLSELALHGRFKQVPSVLWYRRYWGLASYERQRAAFFPNGYPLYSYLPWWIVHGAVLLWRLVLRGAGRPHVGRALGAYSSTVYILLAIMMETRRRLKGIRRLSKLARRRGAAWKNGVVRVLKVGRRWVLARISERDVPTGRSTTARALADVLIRNRRPRAFVEEYLVPLVMRGEAAGGAAGPAHSTTGDDGAHPQPSAATSKGPHVEAPG